MKQIITASAKTTTNIIHSLAENIMDATPTVEVSITKEDPVTKIIAIKAVVRK